MQSENQKTLSLLPCSKPAGCSNLTKKPSPSLRGYRGRQKNSLHSDRKLGDTKHALADMDGRLCASQVAEQSMQHPAKGRQKARSYIEADLLDCPNRIACLLPYPPCPATNKKQTSSTERAGGRRYDFGNLRISSTQSKSASDSSSSLVLPRRPRLTAAVAPYLSPAPHLVLSRCAVSGRSRITSTCTQPDTCPGEGSADPQHASLTDAPQRDTPRTPRLPSRPRRP